MAMPNFGALDSPIGQGSTHFQYRTFEGTDDGRRGSLFSKGSSDINARSEDRRDHGGFEVEEADFTSRRSSLDAVFDSKLAASPPPSSRNPATSMSAAAQGSTRRPSQPLAVGMFLANTSDFSAASSDATEVPLPWHALENAGAPSASEAETGGDNEAETPSPNNDFFGALKEPIPLVYRFDNLDHSLTDHQEFITALRKEMIVRLELSSRLVKKMHISLADGQSDCQPRCGIIASLSGLEFREMAEIRRHAVGRAFQVMHVVSSLQGSAPQHWERVFKSVHDATLQKGWRIRDVFKAMDVDHSGKLNHEKLSNGLSELGHNLEPNDLAELYKANNLGNMEENFQIVLQKDDASAPWGMKLEWPSDKKPVILTNISGAPLEAWQRINPSKKVEPGDEIVAVNGLKGDADDITAAMRGQTKIELNLRRNAGAGLSLVDFEQAIASAANSLHRWQEVLDTRKAEAALMAEIEETRRHPEQLSQKAQMEEELNAYKAGVRAALNKSDELKQRKKKREEAAKQEKRQVEKNDKRQRQNELIDKNANKQIQRIQREKKDLQDQKAQQASQRRENLKRLEEFVKKSRSKKPKRAGSPMTPNTSVSASLSNSPASAWSFSPASSPLSTPPISPRTRMASPVPSSSSQHAAVRDANDIWHPSTYDRNPALVEGNPPLLTVGGRVLLNLIEHLKQNRQKPRIMFLAMDKNENGCVTAMELQIFLKRYGHQLFRGDVADLMKLIIDSAVSRDTGEHTFTQTQFLKALKNAQKAAASLKYENFDDLMAPVSSIAHRESAKKRWQELNDAAAKLQSVYRGSVTRSSLFVGGGQGNDKLGGSGTEQPRRSRAASISSVNSEEMRRLRDMDRDRDDRIKDLEMQLLEMQKPSDGNPSEILDCLDCIRFLHSPVGSLPPTVLGSQAERERSRIFSFSGADAATGHVAKLSGSRRDSYISCSTAEAHDDEEDTGCKSGQTGRTQVISPQVASFQSLGAGSYAGMDREGNELIESLWSTSSAHLGEHVFKYRTSPDLNSKRRREFDWVGADPEKRSDMFLVGSSGEENESRSAFQVGSIVENNDSRSAFQIGSSGGENDSRFANMPNDADVSEDVRIEMLQSGSGDEKNDSRSAEACSDEDGTGMPVETIQTSGSDGENDTSYDVRGDQDGMEMPCEMFQTSMAQEKDDGSYIDMRGDGLTDMRNEDASLYVHIEDEENDLIFTSPVSDLVELNAESDDFVASPSFADDNFAASPESTESYIFTGSQESYNCEESQDFSSPPGWREDQWRGAWPRKRRSSPQRSRTRHGSPRSPQRRRQSNDDRFIEIQNKKFQVSLEQQKAMMRAKAMPVPRFKNKTVGKPLPPKSLRCPLNLPRKTREAAIRIQALIRAKFARREYRGLQIQEHARKIIQNQKASSDVIKRTFVVFFDRDAVRQSVKQDLLAMAFDELQMRARSLNIDDDIIEALEEKDEPEIALVELLMKSSDKLKVDVLLNRMEADSVEETRISQKLWDMFMSCEVNEEGLINGRELADAMRADPDVMSVFDITEEDLVERVVQRIEDGGIVWSDFCHALNNGTYLTKEKKDSITSTAPAILVAKRTSTVQALLPGGGKPIASRKSWAHPQQASEQLVRGKLLRRHASEPGAAGGEIPPKSASSKDQDLLAAKIQAAFRGWGVRKKMKKQPIVCSCGTTFLDGFDFCAKCGSKRPEEKRPRPKRMSNHRSSWLRKRDQEELDQAAARIQAASRGWKVRKNAKKPVSAEEKHPQIRPEWRREGTEEEQQAAAKIQALLRGVAVRKPRVAEEKRPKKRYSGLRQNNEKDYEEAAAKIQAACRGWGVRKKLNPNAGETSYVVITSIKHPGVGENGHFFYFSSDNWLAVFGTAPGGTEMISQWRNGEKIWDGSVIVKDNQNGVHGRRDIGAFPGQWQVGDVIRKEKRPKIPKEHHLAASKIQAVHRGRAVRKKAKKEKDEQVRADLQGLKLGPLKKKAKDEQISEAEIEKIIDDADDPLQALIELIVNARAAKESMARAKATPSETGRFKVDVDAQSTFTEKRRSKTEAEEATPAEKRRSLMEAEAQPTSTEKRRSKMEADAQPTSAEKPRSMMEAEAQSTPAAQRRSMMEAEAQSTPAAQRRSKMEPTPLEQRGSMMEAVVGTDVLAQQIMLAADQMSRNGELSVVELKTFLGAGTKEGKNYGDFMDWLFENRNEHLKEWDGNHDGAISLRELKGAVAAFYLEEVPIAPALAAVAEVDTANEAARRDEVERQRAAEEAAEAASKRRKKLIDHFGEDKLHRLQKQFSLAVSTNGGGTKGWKALLKKCDKDKNGTLCGEEFRLLIRKQLRISPSTVTDDDISKLVKALDNNESDSLDIDELADFVERGSDAFFDASAEASQQPISKLKCATLAMKAGRILNDGLSNPTLAEKQQFKNAAQAMLTTSEKRGSKINAEVERQKAEKDPSERRRNLTDQLGEEKLERLQKQLKLAASVNGGGSKGLKTLLKKSDKDRSGTLSRDEFRLMIRKKLKISPRDVTDEDIFKLARALDDNEAKSLDIDEIADFLERGAEALFDARDEGNPNRFSRVTSALSSGLRSRPSKLARLSIRESLKRADISKYLDSDRVKILQDLFEQEVKKGAHEKHPILSKICKDPSAVCSVDELMLSIREELNIKPLDMGDSAIRAFCEALSQDDSASVSADDIMRFIEKGSDAFFPGDKSAQSSPEREIFEIRDDSDSDGSGSNEFGMNIRDPSRRPSLDVSVPVLDEDDEIPHLTDHSPAMSMNGQTGLSPMTQQFDLNVQKHVDNLVDHRCRGLEERLRAMERVVAATGQRVGRGPSNIVERRRMSQLMQNAAFDLQADVAAIRIQSVYRGIRARQTVAELRRSKSLEVKELQRQLKRTNSASQIQAEYRAHRARMSMSICNDEVDSDDDLQELQQEPLRLMTPRRGAHSAEAYGMCNPNTFADDKPIDKSAEHNARIFEALRLCPFFELMGANCGDTIAQNMHVRDVRPGECVMHQGDIGSTAFVVLEGNVDVYNDARQVGGISPKLMSHASFVRTLPKGRFFGELTLMWAIPRARSVYARGPSKLAAIERKTWQEMVTRKQIIANESTKQSLRKVHVFDALNDEQVAKLAEVVTHRNLKPGQVLVREGNQIEQLCVVLSGECTKHSQNGQPETVSHQVGTIIGERTLLERTVSCATIVAKSSLKVLCLSRRRFERLFGPLDQIRKQHLLADPRSTIAEYFRSGDARGPFGLCDGSARLGEASEWFSVYRLTSKDAVSKMTNNAAVGSPSCVKGRSSKMSRFAGCVPYMQISENADKFKIVDALPDAWINVFYVAEVYREAALTRMQEYMKPGAAFFLMSDHGIHRIDSVLGAFGLSVPEAILRAAYITDQDISFPAGWETGCESNPAFMDMNIETLRCMELPGVVLYQADLHNPMNPHGLLVARIGDRINPVVPAFDTFMFGSRNVTYDQLPMEQTQAAHWALDKTAEILENPGDSSWNARWASMLRDWNSNSIDCASNLWLGDRTSMRIHAGLREATSACGAVSDHMECFNYTFPRELDESYLVVWEGFGQTVDRPWSCMSQFELRTFLLQRVTEGFAFPLHPVCAVRDAGWYEVFEAMQKNSLTRHVSEAWYPLEAGLVQRVRELHRSFPKGFVGTSSHARLALSQMGTKVSEVAAAGIDVQFDPREKEHLVLHLARRLLPKARMAGHGGLCTEEFASPSQAQLQHGHEDFEDEAELADEPPAALSQACAELRTLMDEPPATLNSERLAVPSVLRSRRAARSAEPPGAQSLPAGRHQMQVSWKSLQNRRTIQAALADDPLFNSVSAETCTAIIDAMEVVILPDGECIMKQNDLNGMAFVILSGHVNVFHEPRFGQSSFMRSLSAGSLVDTRALLWPEHGLVSCYAQGLVVLAQIERRHYQMLCIEEHVERRNVLLKSLQRIPSLEVLDIEQLAKLVDVVEMRVYQQGETIIRQGEDGQGCFIVVTGECIASTKVGTDLEGTSRTDQEVACYLAGDGFGEHSLVERTRQKVSIIARARTEVAHIRPEKFDRLFGQALTSRIKSQDYSHDPRRSLGKFYRPGNEHGPLGMMFSKASSRSEPSDSTKGDTHWFGVFSRITRDSLSHLINGTAIGKGLNIHGRAARKGHLLGLIPFMQISDNDHKDLLETSPVDARVKIYFKSPTCRSRALAHFSILVDELHLDPLIALEGFQGLYGIDLPERAMRAAIITKPNLRYPFGWDTGWASDPSFMNLNMQSLRSRAEGQRVVLLQSDCDNPLNPHGLLMALEDVSIKPVVPELNLFTTGSRGMSYSQLPDEQVRNAQWLLNRTREILRHPSPASWPARWLQVLCEAEHQDCPTHGLGDAQSEKIVDALMLATAESRAVRRRAECFNFHCPHELDDSYLVVWEGFTDSTGQPWDIQSGAELRAFLLDRISDGFAFPLNPIWAVRDEGWYNVFKALQKSDDARAAFDAWYPPWSGLAASIDAIHKETPDGFPVSARRSVAAATQRSQFEELDTYEQAALILERARACHHDRVSAAASAPSKVLPTSSVHQPLCNAQQHIYRSRWRDCKPVASLEQLREEAKEEAIAQIDAAAKAQGRPSQAAVHTVGRDFPLANMSSTGANAAARAKAEAEAQMKLWAQEEAKRCEQRLAEARAKAKADQEAVEAERTRAMLDELRAAKKSCIIEDFERIAEPSRGAEVPRSRWRAAGIAEMISQELETLESFVDVPL